MENNYNVKMTPKAADVLDNSYRYISEELFATSAATNILETFNIERSLSRKGNPYDKAVCEAMNKVLKVEFIYQNKFEALEELELQLAEYIHWYNNIRIHGSLGYISPVEYRYRESLELVA